ncbi:MAG: hypothetical protein R6U40_03030 [Desulfobacterales bacterium]
MIQPSLGAIMAICAGVLIAITPAAAQRGMGQNMGLGMQGEKPSLVTLEGEVKELVTEECRQTTGRSLKGTHVMIQSEGGEEINIHLGNAAAVENIAQGLEPGQKITLEVFRTDLMPANHYVAKTIRTGNESLELRDESLQPFRAGQTTW